MTDMCIQISNDTLASIDHSPSDRKIRIADKNRKIYEKKTVSCEMKHGNHLFLYIFLN